MKEIGLMISNKEKEYLQINMKFNIYVNMWIIRKMGKQFINIHKKIKQNREQAFGIKMNLINV